MKGWKWSNGETVTAQDVLFWIHMQQAVGAQDWFDFVPGLFPSNVSDIKAVSPTELTMTMAKPYNTTWFTYNELSQITPLPAAWDRTASGPSDCAAVLADCAKVYSYLNSQAKAQSSWAGSPVWSVVDGPWKLAAFTSDGHATFVPNPAYSGPVKPTLAKFEEVGAPNCKVAGTSCDWDMANWGGGWSFEPDYYPTGETLFASGGAVNSGGYSSPENNSLIDQTLTTNSLTPLYNWQNYLSTQVPYIWEPNAAYELSEISDSLRGVLPQNPTGQLNLEDWYFVK
jgi:ABC-type transport system substrate-binding protein